MSEFVSKEIFEKMKKELEYLKSQRIEIAERLKRSASFGDLSENSEYQQAREDKDELERKILKLEQKLKTVKVKNKSESNNKVSFYSKVKIKDKNGNEMNLILVSEEDSDFAQGKISYNSPLGKALLGKKIGDIIKFKVPSGKEKEYQIISIE
jgi:transcription elongation factor GreA